MKNTCILILILLLTTFAFSQKKSNPTIGKKEFEISLFYFSEYKKEIYLNRAQNLAGAQIVRRWSWKKYTKVGAGGLVGADDYDPIHESDFVPYGALFGDITQFLGKRQKWSINGQIGHGIFKRERKFGDANYEGVRKYSAGMYYSISVNYRSIISKKILIVISPAYTFRNIRHKATEEIYSPPSVEEYSYIEKLSGPGIRLGIIF